MSPAGDAPEFQWSPAHVDRLRRQAAETEAGSLNRALAGAELAFAERDAAAVDAALEAAAFAQGNPRADHWAFERLLATLLTVQKFDAATRIIREFFGPRFAPRFSFSDAHYQGAQNVVRWSTPNNDFAFSCKIFKTDATRTIFYFFARWLPLFAHYRAKRVYERGWVDISLSDGGVRPGLAASDYRAGYVLVPDPLYVSSHGYRDIRQHHADHPVAWEDRRPTALWRGGTSGHSTAGWRNLPRAKLCELTLGASQHALFDVGFAAASDRVSRADIDEMRAAGFWKPYIRPYDFARYKVQIDIDGNTNSWPGLFQKLLTGSPVLKIASAAARPYRQWYYSRLEPMVNYMPVEPDMSDLVDKARWLLEHDREAREIGCRGRELALDLGYESQLESARSAIDAAVKSNEQTLTEKR